MKVNYEMRLKNSEKKITYIHVHKFSPPFPPLPSGYRYMPYKKY
jgi:hypothetical protein